MPWIALDPTTAVAAPITTAGAPLTNVGDTLDSLRTDLKSQLATRADATSPRLTKWINRAYRHLSAMLPLPELKISVGLPLAISQPFYRLPQTVTGHTSIAAIRQVGIIDTDTYRAGGIPLEFISEQQYRDLPDRTAEPTSIFRYGNMVVLWPTPQSVRTIVLDGRIRVQDLSADTDSPIFPIEWHEGILLAARYRALRDLREWKEAAIANNDFVAFIRVIQDNESEEQTNQTVKITPVNAKVLRRGGTLTGRWPEENW